MVTSGFLAPHLALLALMTGASSCDERAAQDTYPHHTQHTYKHMHVLAHMYYTHAHTNIRNSRAHTQYTYTTYHEFTNTLVQ